MNESARLVPTALSRIASAVPDLGLSAAFLITWIDPLRLGERMVAYFMLVMLLEFIIVHSSAFMGHVALADGIPGSKKTLMLLGLGAFYSLFALGFALGFSAWWPVWTILGLTLNRIVGVLLNDAPTEKQHMQAMAEWAVSVVCYIGFVFATILLPIPRLGITPAVQAAQDLPGSGLWVDEPHRVLAFGVLYFGAMGLVELRGVRLPDRWSGPTTPKGERGPSLRQRWRRRRIQKSFRQGGGA